MATLQQRVLVPSFVSVLVFMASFVVLLAAAFDWWTSTTVHWGWLGVAGLALGLALAPFTRVV